ncbi:hypothetical protein [Pseudogracilibacillus sp. SO30301A]|uniref:hypothetical protein n=1 Tax=Pseudogracilibacillus sp. SO30301A TaxID=3098291 RepID=UPI00300DD642
MEQFKNKNLEEKIALRLRTNGFLLKDENNSRLQWLRNLGVVEYSDFENLYKINNKGQDYLEIISGNFELHEKNEIKTTEHDEIMNSIPSWIECFINLVYDSNWLGKSGETDVLAQTKTAPVPQYKIIIDAKSTSSPIVSDSLIDFDTEYKQKYNADYIVVVGIKFDKGRVVKRAKEYEVLC